MILRNPCPQKANSGKYEQRKINKSCYLDLKFRLFFIIQHYAFRFFKISPWKVFIMIMEVWDTLLKFCSQR